MIPDGSQRWFLSGILLQKRRETGMILEIENYLNFVWNDIN